MSRTIRLLILALGLGALLAPAAAQASPTQTSIMMDDDLLVYRDDSTAARALTQMKSLGVDTVRVTVLWKTVAENARFSKAELKQAQGQVPDRGQEAEHALQGGQPEHVPDPQLGSLRQPPEVGGRPRHPRLLQRHRPRPDVGARQAAGEEQQPARDVEAQARGLQAVRAGRRQALRRDLPRRERQPRRPPARALLVAVERAQPGRLAVAAVGAPRRRDRAGVAGAVSQAAPVRLPRPAGLRPPRRHRHHPHGRDGAARLGRPQRQGADAPGLLPARARVHPAQRHAVRRRRPRRRATAATSPRAGR